MASLAARALDVYDGEHIAELLEIEASDELRAYAREWLVQFRDDQDAPDLLAALMETVPYSDVEQLAEYYIQHAVCDDLRDLVWAILKKDDESIRSYELIAERLEREPKSYTWASGLTHYRYESAVADKLALRWLELNSHEPLTHILSMCTFSRSPEIIESLLLWMKHNPTADENELAMSIQHLMRAAREHHPAVVPELTRFARDWIAKRKDSPCAGHVHCCLIRVANDNCDKDAAKTWYLKHRSAKTAWYVLSALLSIPPNGDQPDEFAIKETKASLERQRPEKRSPALTGSLLQAVKDEDSIRLARELCLAQPAPWILEVLLDCAPDNDLLEIAHGLLSKWNGHEAGSKLLVTCLNAAPDDNDMRELAEAWLACNPRHEAATRVSELLKL